jgi:hypothetical protein
MRILETFRNKHKVAVLLDFQAENTPYIRMTGLTSGAIFTLRQR